MTHSRPRTGNCSRIVIEMLRLDSCLIDQHDRNIVSDGINALALYTLQPASILFENQLSFADGADKNCEELLRDGHPNILVYQRSATVREFLGNPVRQCRARS